MYRLAQYTALQTECQRHTTSSQVPIIVAISQVPIILLAVMQCFRD